MILGISGLKRSGKDTLARFFVDRGWHRYGLADPIKAACSAIFDWSPDHIESHKETVDPRWNISPRRGMQIMGTEVFREMLPRLVEGFPASFWISRMVQEYEGLAPGAEMVVPDVRFLDEAAAIREMGGKIVKVIRPDLQPEHHASEAEVSRITPDYVVLNDGGLEAYLIAAERFADWFVEKGKKV